MTRWMVRGESDVPSTLGWLSTREAARLAALRFTKRRSEYLLRRWVCKNAVATATGIPDDLPGLARIEVANRPSGAPYVLVDGTSSDVDVSLTDRAGWAVCLVGRDLSRVGCDLEIVEPRSPGFVADFLTPTEQRHVASLPPATRDAAANLIWSAKESALKVLHTGLRRDTRSVEVLLGTPDGPVGDEPESTGWRPLEVRTVEGGLFPGWWRRDGSFLVTVAAEQPVPPPEALVGSHDLRSAAPVHSWVGHPVAW